MFGHGNLICDIVTPSILSEVTRSMPGNHDGWLIARILRRLGVTIISLDLWRFSVRLLAFAHAVCGRALCTGGARSLFWVNT